MAAPRYVFDTKHDRYPLAVHVFLVQQGKILLMRRAGSGYADGQLGLPAGHVDLGETPTACAVREVAEELGISLAPDGLRPGGTMFRNSQEPRVDIFFTTGSWNGIPQIREPHKCTELVWADPAALPDDALDFIGQAWNDAQNGCMLREYGFTRSRRSRRLRRLFQMWKGPAAPSIAAKTVVSDRRRGPSQHTDTTPIDRVVTHPRALQFGKSRKGPVLHSSNDREPRRTRFEQLGAASNLSRQCHPIVRFEYAVRPSDGSTPVTAGCLVVTGGGRVIRCSHAQS
jgi:8-oxo-dGTP pyrophosphatase MutT (NUDIX family)